MAEDLKPRGLPYGENAPAAVRQRQAGLPTESAAAAPAAQPAVAPMPSPVRQGSPVTDDPLMALNPVAPVAVAPSPRDRFTAIAERSINPMMKVIAMRLAERETQ